MAVGNFSFALQFSLSLTDIVHILFTRPELQIFPTPSRVWISPAELLTALQTDSESLKTKQHEQFHKR